MRHTRTAITQFSRWYNSTLFKWAIVNMAVFIGAVKISEKTNTTETFLLDCDVLNSDVEAGTSVILGENIAFSKIDAMFSDKTVITGGTFLNAVNSAFYIFFNVNLLLRRNTFSGYIFN